MTGRQPITEVTMFIQLSKTLIIVPENIACVKCNEQTEIPESITPVGASLPVKLTEDEGKTLQLYMGVSK